MKTINRKDSKNNLLFFFVFPSVNKNNIDPANNSQNLKKGKQNNEKEKKLEERKEKNVNQNNEKGKKE